MDAEEEGFSNESTVLNGMCSVSRSFDTYIQMCDSVLMMELGGRRGIDAS